MGGGVRSPREDLGLSPREVGALEGCGQRTEGPDSTARGRPLLAAAGKMDWAGLGAEGEGRSREPGWREGSGGSGPGGRPWARPGGGGRERGGQIRQVGSQGGRALLTGGKVKKPAS